MRNKQKAEQLLKKDKEAEKKCDGILKEWQAKLAKERDPKKRKAIDAKYGARLEKADKEATKTYKNFYDFIFGLFSKKEIDVAVKKSGNFVSKGFITAVFPKTEKPKKATPKKPTAKKPAKNAPKNAKGKKTTKK